VHRDVKAQNVMRERGGRIVLMDFGIGCDTTRPAGPASPGTPVYLAPELLEGAGPSVSSDIYSLGVLLFYLTTGRFPTGARSWDELALAHREGRYANSRDLRPDLPEPLVRIIERALSPTPAKRFQSAGAMLADLAQLSAAPDGTPASGKSTRWLARGGRRFTGALAAIVVLAAALAIPFLIRRAAPSYDVRAVMHLVDSRGERSVSSGDRVAPGDELYLQVEASVPLHVYVVNQDERGEAYLLFPLPAGPVRNPLASGRSHRIPGDRNWVVTSAGGREHFLVLASRNPLGEVEALLSALPAPKVGREVSSALPPGAVERLRGVGGLKPATTQHSALPIWDAPALTSSKETVSGSWARRLTLENAVRDR
jgi:hypothetical protein